MTPLDLIPLRLTPLLISSSRTFYDYGTAASGGHQQPIRRSACGMFGRQEADREGEVGACAGVLDSQKTPHFVCSTPLNDVSSDNGQQVMHDIKQEFPIFSGTSQGPLTTLIRRRHSLVPNLMNKDPV